MAPIEEEPHHAPAPRAHRRKDGRRRNRARHETQQRALQKTEGVTTRELHRLAGEECQKHLQRVDAHHSEAAEHGVVGHIRAHGLGIGKPRVHARQVLPAGDTYCRKREHGHGDNECAPRAARKAPSGPSGIRRLHRRATVRRQMRLSRGEGHLQRRTRCGSLIHRYLSYHPAGLLSSRCPGDDAAPAAPRPADVARGTGIADVCLECREEPVIYCIRDC